MRARLVTRKFLVTKMLSFEEIEHTADRAFRVKGRDLAALLKSAARALRALQGIDVPGRPSGTQEIEVAALDGESLLVNWLNEILYLEQTYHLLCLDFDIYELKIITCAHVLKLVSATEATPRSSRNLPQPANTRDLCRS